MTGPEKEDKVLTIILWSLVLTAFTSGIVIELGPVTINLSQITAIILFLLLIVYNAINNRQFVVLYKDAPSLFIYLYLISNLFSSALFSPVRFESLKGCILIFSYVLIYVSVRWGMKHILDQQRSVKKLMRFNNVSAIFGLGCMIFSLFSGREENIGVSLDHLGTARIA